MPLETFDFCFLQYPIEYKYVKDVRVFKSREGSTREARVDHGPRRVVEIKSSYFDIPTRVQILKFWNDHFPSTKFLFYDRDSGDTFEAWIGSNLAGSKLSYGKGEFAFTIEEVADMPDAAFEIPDTEPPVIYGPPTVDSSTSTSILWEFTAPTDNVGIEEIELEIDIV